MCDVCDHELGHRCGCCLDGNDYSDRDDYGETDHMECSVCGREILCGDEFIFDLRLGNAAVCSDCIEEFEIADVLEICGLSSVTEAISVFSGKVLRAGETY